MKSKKVTMQYIADKVGVSKVTVFKALRNKDGVSADLKQKIEQLANEYGYKIPNNDVDDNEMISKNIVIFCDNKYFDESDISCFYLGIYKKITKHLVKRGCTATLYTIKKSQNYFSILETLKSGQFDGVILLGKLDLSFIKIIENLEIPKVFVDCHNTKTNSDCVVIENFYSTYKITKYLIENGHKDIGFVGSIGVTDSITDRYLGYYKALIENNLVLNNDWIIEDRTKDNEIIHMEVPEVLPTAFVCNCDDTAYKFISLLQKNGIKVPDDISIVSFDNDILSKVCNPKITTVSIDTEKMAIKAVEIILERIKKPNIEKNILELIDGKIIYRDSVKMITT